MLFYNLLSFPEEKLIVIPISILYIRKNDFFHKLKISLVY
ncbi:hypothetical protein A1OE_832 [Candidatus Endolissoclinum faulkneri L2]|uniref:Uncharacterized protein n=1 Tax=Candidatus Endolissoclinum faulkneri L2 TaxID=1193729 RepID=K7YND8_9PROT|nr:hypothetical protein A1OE_832 [Candidatus Endolissoclinum faulkneri L2]